MENPVTTSNGKKALKIFLGVSLSLLAIFGIYWLFIRSSVDMSKVKDLVATAAKNYGANAANAETLILQGVYQIIDSPSAMKIAKTYAKATGVTIEQVLVDNSIANLKNLAFLS